YSLNDAQVERLARNGVVVTRRLDRDLFLLLWQAALQPRDAVRPDPATQAPARLSRDLDRGRYHFQRLPGTRAEGERVGRRPGAKPLLAGAALESRLKARGSPRILHLATHGFFLPDQQPDLGHRFGRNLELAFARDSAGLGRLSGPGMENP